MTGRKWLSVGALAALALVAYEPTLRSAKFWWAFVTPGELTQAHALLDDDCLGCHSPGSGVDNARCISCHANDTALLQRQPTAFHATIGTCVECHREHDGTAGLRQEMDHEALLRVGRNSLPEPAQLREGRLELDCFSCHETRDRHSGYFGRDCAECHSMSRWTIAEFRHPPPTSTACGQCHRPPPSHLMHHFEMVSERVAGVEHANVFYCHR
jgi:hypothetical protein